MKLEKCVAVAPALEPYLSQESVAKLLILWAKERKLCKMAKYCSLRLTRKNKRYLYGETFETHRKISQLSTSYLTEVVSQWESWVGKQKKKNCAKFLRGLKNAENKHFPVRCSLFIGYLKDLFCSIGLPSTIRWKADSERSRAKVSQSPKITWKTKNALLLYLAILGLLYI